MTEQVLPPANWYADPEGSGRWRYWDGSAWTGVYLNQAEPGPSVWSQYWELARPAVFTVAVVATGIAFARGGGFPWFLIATLLVPRGEHRSKNLYAAAFLAALTIGVSIGSGLGYGLGLAGCALAAFAAGTLRERLPEWFVWTVLAFSLSGFGVLWFASSDQWRG